MTRKQTHTYLFSTTAAEVVDRKVLKTCADAERGYSSHQAFHGEGLAHFERVGAIHNRAESVTMCEVASTQPTK